MTTTNPPQPGHSTSPLVATGIGVAAPTGVGTTAYWSATLDGKSGIGPLPGLSTAGLRFGVGGAIADFDAREHLPSRLVVQSDRATTLGLVVAAEALADSGLNPDREPVDDIGVITAVSGPGAGFHQHVLETLFRDGADHVSAYEPFAWFYPATAGQISIRNNLRGLGAAVATEQAGGLDAVAKACRAISGGMSAMVAGAVESALCEWGLAAMAGSGRICAATDPLLCYLPFDRRATGHVPGEGGALLVVETLAGADRRGAGWYGVIAGHAATFDPAPGLGREPGLRRAIESALHHARVRADQVDVVFADAAGVASLDRAEVDVLASVFGPRAVPVTAPKTMTGRLLAGGSALDLATALLSIRDAVIPPTINVVEPAYGDLLDLVHETRESKVRCALVIARGYGGFNSATVVCDAPRSP